MFFLPFVLPIVGYVLGAVALFLGAGALKWWIVGLIVGTWWSRGAISMAIQGRAAGDYGDGTVSFTIAVHWICLASLIACSVIVIAT